MQELWCKGTVMLISACVQLWCSVVASIRPLSGSCTHLWDKEKFWTLVRNYAGLVKQRQYILF